MVGREVGRMKRFLPEDAQPGEARKRRAEQHERLSALMARLQSDPAYAALHKSAMDTLQLYETAAERALEDAIARGDQAEIDAIRRYQVEVLGDARHRLTDEDDPPTMDEMNEIQDNIVNAAPDAVIGKLEPGQGSAGLAPSDTANLTTPKLGG